MNTFDEQYIFRTLEAPMWQTAAELELMCFPPNEACKPEMMKKRVARYPEMFLAAIDRKDGTCAGMIDGAASSRTVLTDDFFTDETLHEPDGENVMILGVMVRPDRQRQGLARELMRRFVEIQKAAGRKKLILTCLEGKIAMYEKFGYTDNGCSVSEWGNEKWHEMIMDISC